MEKHKDSGYNYDQFKRTSELLRKLGYSVYCPTENFPDTPGSLHHRYYVRAAFNKILEAAITNAGGIAILDHAYESVGSVHEISLAQWCYMPIATVNQWVDFATRKAIEKWQAATTGQADSNVSEQQFGTQSQVKQTAYSSGQLTGPINLTLPQSIKCLRCGSLSHTTSDCAMNVAQTGSVPYQPMP